MQGSSSFADTSRDLHNPFAAIAIKTLDIICFFLRCLATIITATADYYVGRLDINLNKQIVIKAHQQLAITYPVII